MKEMMRKFNVKEMLEINKKKRKSGVGEGTIYIYIHTEKQGDWVIGYGGVLDQDMDVLGKENRGQTGDEEWRKREERRERRRTQIDFR